MDSSFKALKLAFSALVQAFYFGQIEEELRVHFIRPFKILPIYFA